MVTPLPTLLAATLMFCAGFLNAALAQRPAVEADLLEWNEFYFLSWDDFRGNPGSQSIGDAGAVVQIKAKPYYAGKKIHYNVTAYFNRSKSWVRDTSPSLLRHERLHFDIAELYARKIRKKIAELSRRNIRDLDTYNAAIRDLLDESNAADMKYDIETLHGAMQKRQQEWEHEVESQLRDLDEFRKRRKVIAREG